MAHDPDWIEIFKIQQLIYRYFDSVNRGDLGVMRTLFADDAVWEEPFFGFREESADGFVEFFRNSTEAAELLVITPHCPAIRMVSANEAQATTTIDEFTRGAASEDGSFGPQGTAVNFQHIGIYYDDIALIGDSWKFTHRLVVPVYFASGAVTGDVLAGRESLLDPRTP
jgi:ketosteroid isomerase-like protein